MYVLLRLFRYIFILRCWCQSGDHHSCVVLETRMVNLVSRIETLHTNCQEDGIVALYSCQLRHVS
jgi:hypothetical protein